MALPRRALSLAALLAIAPAITTARSASAEEWIYESDDVEDRAAAIVRFSTRLDLWVSVFDRPPRACEVISNRFRSDIPLVARSLRVAQGRFPPGADDGPSCPSSSSEELGIGTGVEVSFRVLRPLHLTVGIDIIYTTPDTERLKNQIIIPVPFGILLTSYEWTFRPIVRGVLMPILYVTDDARDYTLGADLGVAWRMVDFGDLSFTVGYKTSDTMDGFQLELALHPLP